MPLFVATFFCSKIGGVIPQWGRFAAGRPSKSQSEGYEWGWSSLSPSTYLVKVAILASFAMFFFSFSNLGFLVVLEKKNNLFSDVYFQFVFTTPRNAGDERFPFSPNSDFTNVKDIGLNCHNTSRTIPQLNKRKQKDYQFVIKIEIKVNLTFSHGIRYEGLNNTKIDVDYFKGKRNLLPPEIKIEMVRPIPLVKPTKIDIEQKKFLRPEGGCRADT